MRQFILGTILGMLVMGVGAEAARFYDSNGAPAAPSGSVQQFDYFRQRQQQLDIGAMRRQMEQDRQRSYTNPCGR